MGAALAYQVSVGGVFLGGIGSPSDSDGSEALVDAGMVVVLMRVAAATAAGEPAFLMSSGTNSAERGKVVTGTYACVGERQSLKGCRFTSTSFARSRGDTSAARRVGTAECVRAPLQSYLLQSNQLFRTGVLGEEQTFLNRCASQVDGRPYPRKIKRKVRGNETKP